MRSLVAIMGAWLIAAAAAEYPRRALAAEPLADQAYWPAATADGAAPHQPKVVDYNNAPGVAATGDAQAPASPAAAVAEFGSDRSSTSPAEARPALIEHDADAPPVRLRPGSEPNRDAKNDGAAVSPLYNVLRQPRLPAVRTAPIDSHVVAIATTPAADAAALPAAASVPATAEPTGSAAVSSGSADAAASSFTLGGHAEKSSLSGRSSIGALFTLGGSLAVVLGLFLVIAWTMRKASPRGSLVLPKEVFEVLGRATLGARQQVQLLRCGNKLLLVSITPHGTESLTEVTDPLEVDRIAGLCHQQNPKSSTAAFRQVFQQVARPSVAEAEAIEAGGPRRRRYRWEEKHA